MWAVRKVSGRCRPLGPLYFHLPSVGKISEGYQHKIAGQGQAEEDWAKLRKNYHHRKKKTVIEFGFFMQGTEDCLYIWVDVWNLDNSYFMCSTFL